MPFDGVASGVQILKIDFSGLDPGSPGGQRWDAVRAEVMEAIRTHGFFQAVLGEDKLRKELLDGLFGAPLDELFAVPMENKMKIVTDKHYESYIQHGTFEILILKDPSDLDSVRSFAGLLWPPEGNPNFCNKIWSIAKPLSDLELMMRRMIMEGLNVGKHFDSHVEPMRQVVRLARYEPPLDKESLINMPEHTDMNTLSVVYQHEEEGLEIQTHGGQWVQPPQNSFTVIIGETLMAMTNGTLKPNVHRVKTACKNGTRYSLGFSSHFKDGYMIRVLDEFVDDEHPKLFNPYEYGPYMQFRMTEAGINAECALKAYCGTDASHVVAI